MGQVNDGEGSLQEAGEMVEQGRGYGGMEVLWRMDVLVPVIPCVGHVACRSGCRLSR